MCYPIFHPFFREEQNNARRVFLLNLRGKGGSCADSPFSLIKSVFRAQEPSLRHRTAPCWSTAVQAHAGKPVYTGWVWGGVVYRAGSEYLPGRSMSS